MLVDPTGMLDTDYGIYTSKDGRKWVKRIGEENDKPDRLFKLDANGKKVDINNDGKMTEGKDYVTVKDKGLLSTLSKIEKSKEGFGIQYSYTKNKDDAFKIFLFAANNSDAEWSIMGFKDGRGKKRYLLGTFGVDGQAPGVYSYQEKVKEQLFDIHSHPGVNGITRASGGDMEYYRIKYEDGCRAYHGVYEVENKSFYKYNGKKSFFMRYIGTNYKRFYFGKFLSF